MQPDDLDALFHALAHRDRRRILDIVRARPGCRVDDVCREFTTSRVAILKHLKVLAQADLILSDKVGRERRLHFNVIPIQIIHDRWAGEYGALWAGALTRIKYRVEDDASCRGEDADGEHKRHA